MYCPRTSSVRQLLKVKEPDPSACTVSSMGLASVERYVCTEYPSAVGMLTAAVPSNDGNALLGYDPGPWYPARSVMLMYTGRGCVVSTVGTTKPPAVAAA